MHDKVKKRIVVILLSLVLLVTFSYAWINDIKPPTGKYMVFEFDNGKAKTASSEFEVELYYDGGKDGFVNMTKYITAGENQDLHIFDNFAPGDQQRFRIDIKNIGTTTLYLNILLANIVCDEGLQEYIEVGTSGYENFPATVVTPKPYGTTLADGMNSGKIGLADNVPIPAGNMTVSVYFYVIFASEATQAFENKGFDIGSINFMSV